MKEALDRPLVEKLFLYLPAAASVVALCYDVGYFSSIGFEFFTLFTLSEHLLFALQKLPYAMMAVIALTFALTLWERVSARTITTGKRWISHIVLVYAVMAALTLISYFLQQLELAVFGALLILVGLSELLLRDRKLAGGTSKFLAGYIFVMLFALLLGRADAKDFFEIPMKQYVVTKSQEKHPANIIRSGERGVLSYDPVGKRIMFRTWNAVEAIETAK